MTNDAGHNPWCAFPCEDYTLNWRKMLARGIAVVGPTIQLELDIQAMFASHDTPTPPE